MNDAKRRLIGAGFLLFLFSMLTGFAIPSFANPRGGLSAHLSAVQGGTFLIAAGLAWSEIRLGNGAAKAAFWLAIYGCFGNWAWNVLNSILATHEATPIAGAGHTGAPDWQEKLVLALLGTAVLSITSASVLFVVGTWKRLPVAAGSGS